MSYSSALFVDENITTPTRAEIPESDTWDLTHLFSDVGKWEEDVAWITETYPRITQWKGRVGESVSSLADLLEFENQLDLKIERVYHFASLQLAEDSANNGYLARIGQLQNLTTKIGETMAFVVPETQAIEDTRWLEFLRDPALGPWRVSLDKIRRLRPHVLSSLGSVSDHEPQSRDVLLADHPCLKHAWHRAGRLPRRYIRLRLRRRRARLR